MLFIGLLLIGWYGIVVNSSQPLYVVNNVLDNFTPNATYCVVQNSTKCNFRSAWSACNNKWGGCTIQLPAYGVLSLNASIGLLSLQDFQQVQVLGGKNTTFYNTGVKSLQGSKIVNAGTRSNTNSAQQNYFSYCLNACFGTTLTISGCNAATKGDTFFRLFKNGVEVTSNDDSCGAKSKITYIVPSSPCSQYCARLGCYGTGSCTISAVITTSYVTPCNFITYTQQNSTATKTSLTVRNVKLIGFGNTQSNGGAFYLNGNMQYLLENIYFRANKGSLGGAIYVTNNIFPSQLIRNCTFIANTAGSGGAVYFDTQVQYAKLQNNQFMSNTASKNGGAVGINTYNKYITINSCTFSDSSSINYGGVFYMNTYNSNINITQITSINAIASMSAVLHIDSYNSHILFDTAYMTNCVCKSGSGGCIQWNSYNANITFNNLQMINGTAPSKGGCMYASLSNSFINMYNIYMESCVAGEDGGAMYISGDRLSLENITIVQSSAGRYAGGLYMGQTDKMLLKNVYSYNASGLDTGGFLYCYYCTNLHMENVMINSSFATLGGSMYFSSSSNNTLLNVKFYNSSAQQKGGSLHFFKSTSFLLSGCQFSHGRAGDSGGAIYIEKQVANFIITNSTFTNCKAVSDSGGAIFTDSGNNNLVISNNIFQNCSALKYGGGVIINRYNNFITFQKNQVTGCLVLQGDGGGLAINQFNSDISIQENIFEENQAIQSNGGGMAVIYSNTRVLLSTNTFTKNIAKSKGGAVYLQNSNVLFSIVDSLAASSIATVQSAHPYISGYPSYPAMNPHIIFNDTVTISGATECIIVFDNQCNMYYTDTFTIYDSVNKTNILFRTTNGENIFPGVNIPALIILQNSFYFEFTGPNYFGVQVATGFYGFTFYTYPVFPVVSTQPDRFIGNVAESGGGAIAFDISNNFPVLINSYFERNKANGDAGAVFFNFGNVGVVMSQAVFQENTASVSGGAVEFLSGHYGGFLTKCIFQGNVALKGNGGGLTVSTGNGNGIFPYGNTFELSNCTFVNNSAQLVGGGLYINNKNSVEISACVFEENQAITSNGGGIGISNENSVSISSNNWISHNTAGGNGGGVGIMTGNAVTFLNNNTLYSNVANIAGGGMSVENSDLRINGGILSLIGNQAEFLGGGIFLQSMALWQYGSHSAGIKLTKNLSPRGSAWAFDDISSSRVGNWTNIIVEQNRASVGGTSFWIYDKSTLSSMHTLIAGLKSPAIIWNNNLAPYGVYYATQGVKVYSPHSYLVNQFNGESLHPPISMFMLDYYQQFIPLNGTSSVVLSVENTSTSTTCSGQNPFLSGSDTIGSGISFVRGYATFSHLEAYCSPKGNMTVQFTVLIGSEFRTVIPSYKAEAYYIKNTTQLTFRHCQAGEFQSASNCLPCPSGSYSLYEDSLECADCSKTTGVASCEKEQIVVQSNYWRRFNYTTAVMLCPLSGACLGGNITGNALCAEGYEGPLCAVCSYGYAQVKNECIACTSSQQISPTLILIFVAIGIVIACLSGYVYLRYIYVDTTKNASINAFNIYDQMQNGTLNILQVVYVWLKFKYTELGPKLKIIVSTMQIIGSAGVVLSVDMPNVFKDFSNSLNFLTLDISSIIPLDCTGEFNYMTTLLITTLFPIILTILLVIGIGIEYGYRRYQVFVSNAEKSMEEILPVLTMLLEEIFDKYINYIFILTYLVLPSVTTTIFQAFICQSIDPNNENQSNDDNYYLVVDRSISCETDYYHNWMIYAIFMTLLYPIGIPTMYLIVLYQNQEEISQRNNPIAMEEIPLLTNTAEEETIEQDEKKFAVMKHVKEEVIEETNNPMLQTNATDKDVEEGAAVAITIVSKEEANENPSSVITKAPVTTRKLSPSASRLTFLFAAYKPELWYWEVVETTRRLMLTAVLSVCGSGTSLQSIVSIVLAFIYIKLYSTFHPYNRLRNGVLSETGQAQIFFTYFVALILQNSLLTGDGWDNFLGYLLIFLNLSVICITIYFELESYQLQREKFSKYMQEKRDEAERQDKEAKEKQLQALAKKNAALIAEHSMSTTEEIELTTYKSSSTNPNPSNK